MRGDRAPIFHCELQIPSSQSQLGSRARARELPTTSLSTTSMLPSAPLPFLSSNAHFLESLSSIFNLVLSLNINLKQKSAEYTYFKLVFEECVTLYTKDFFLFIHSKVKVHHQGHLCLVFSIYLFKYLNIDRFTATISSEHLQTSYFKKHW